MAKEIVERFVRSSAIGEGRERLGDFFHLGVCEYFLSLPVAGEAFKKVIALDVTVVVRPRNIGWVQVN